MMLWTATSSARDAMDVVLLRPPRFEGRKCKRSRQRSGYSAVSLSGSRRRCGGQYCPPSPAQATLRVAFLQQLPSCLVGIEAWTLSHHQSGARTLREPVMRPGHASLIGGDPRSSSGSLAKVAAICRASSRRQPIWSPSGATQRYVRNRGRRSGSARLALETTLMTDAVEKGLVIFGEQ
jgi:hypothetical protein